MAVFDRDMDDDDVEEAPVKGSFTVQLGTESRVVKKKPGMTIRDAFVMNAVHLGLNFSKELKIRSSRGGTVNADSAPQANVVYTATISHEEKG